MVTGREPIRTASQHPFAVPPDRRDPAPGFAGTNTAIGHLGSML
jgi:hypothetical protein